MNLPTATALGLSLRMRSERPGGADGSVVNYGPGPARRTGRIDDYVLEIAIELFPQPPARAGGSIRDPISIAGRSLRE